MIGNFLGWRCWRLAGRLRRVRSRAEQARREEPRQDEARQDEPRRDEGEGRESGEGEGRRHKSKSERRRERSERESGSENGDGILRRLRGASSYGRRADTNRAGQAHDLSVDEAQGGHTLSKHVARSDAELQERLQREAKYFGSFDVDGSGGGGGGGGPGAGANNSRISQWTARGARRPNLAMDYHGDAAQPVGRCMQRGASAAVPARDADCGVEGARDGDGFYVLTTYPECPR